jgi:TonB-linked SusC/RagA family outer membrane protein
MKRFALYGMVFMALSVLPAFAQTLEISGKVTSKSDGEPLPGAMISVKGTTIFTTADGTGSYLLRFEGRDSATIEFSFSGFKLVTREVSQSTSGLDVALEESPLEVMEEVVITGFATTVKRRNAANSVASISAEELTRAPAPTLDSAISGKFPGVTVSQNSGAPGGGINIKLRGTSTIFGNSSPLYVIDGMIISNDEIQSGANLVTGAAAGGNSNPNQDQPTNRLADLIPADIESIEVLKGPAAAAIYGSKASNGVIIISTKKGRAGETQYSFTQGYGQRSIIRNVGVRRFTEETALATYGETGLALFREGNFVDYEEEMYGNEGDIFETNFSARGGNEKTRFFFSFNALNDEGIIKETGYDKYGMRLNLEHNINERLNISLNTAFTRSTSDRGLTGNDNTTTSFGYTLAFTPSFVDLRPDENGVYPDNPFASSNPLQTRDLMKNEETVNRTLISGKLDYNILQTASQSLDFNLSAGMDYYSMEQDLYFPNELQFEPLDGLPGTAIIGETESRFENLYLNLTHTLYSGDWTFTTTAGLQYEEQDVNNINTAGQSLIEGQSNVDNASSIVVSQTRTIQRDQGFFIQEEITIGEAILITAGVRGDSSSVNGDTDKFYTYPKASGSIRLSEYDFWKPLKDTFNEFKVRLAWGETGNLPPTTAKFSAFTLGSIDGLPGLVPGTTLGSPDIKPETAEEIEFGIDGSLFDSRATFEFSYFTQEISDLFLFRNPPASTGFTREAFNGGTMDIDGIEIGINLNPIKTDDFNWTTGINYYTIDQEITSLEVPPFTVGGFSDGLGTYLVQEGLSPTTIVGNIPDGNGGTLTRFPIGDSQPDFQIGWDSELEYKDFTLSWLFDWSEGNDAINLFTFLQDLGGTTPDLDDPSGIARSSTGGDTRRFVEDASYVRLRELRLDYNFRRGMVDAISEKIDYIRVSLSGRNIKTWTDYFGYDPEVSNFGNVPIGGSVDVAPYPSSKTWHFTVSAGF